MFLKKYNKNIKRPLAGLIAAVLTVFTLSSCSLWSPVTNLSFCFRNSSSYDVVVEYEGIESEGIDTVSVLSNTKKRTLLFYGYDGRLAEPTEDDFSSYLHYFKVFIDDSLVYTQNPTDISLWPERFIRADDDPIWQYFYYFTFQDSLISYEQIP